MVWRGGHRSQLVFSLRVPPNACLRACLPFSSLVLHNINRGIFETIVEQAPLAIEDIMNEMEEEEGEMSEDDGQEQGVASKKPPEGEAYSVFTTTCLSPLCHLPWACLVSSFLPLPPKSVIGLMANVSLKNRHRVTHSPGPCSLCAILTPRPSLCHWSPPSATPGASLNHAA